MKPGCGATRSPAFLWEERLALSVPTGTFVVQEERLFT